MTPDHGGVRGDKTQKAVASYSYNASPVHPADSAVRWLALQTPCAKTNCYPESGDPEVTFMLAAVCMK